MFQVRMVAEDFDVSENCGTAFDAFNFITKHNALQFEDDINCISIASEAIGSGQVTLYEDEGHGDKLVITVREV